MNKRAFGIGVSAMVALTSSCAKTPAAVEAASSSSTSQAIINGAACGPEVEPTAVAVMVDASISFPSQGGGSQTFDIVAPMCTGTLIAPDVVLLAAHCVDLDLLTYGFGTVERGDFYVTFEADLSRYSVETEEPLPLPESAVPVRSFVAHPEFDINALGANGTVGVEHDIALLFLEVPITTVQPEVVVTAAEAAQLSVGDAVSIAGWGQRGSAQNAPAGIKQCGATTLDELGESLMQVGNDAASIRKCHGDSGGPTYIEVETSSTIKRRVIGVTSRAYDESDCARGGVDTRVDYYLPFIEEQMSSRCATDERVWCDVDGIIPASFYETPAGEGEGEGEPGEGEGEGEDEGPGDGDDDEDAPGCSGVPAGSTFAFAAVLLALRRRRR
ncbi:MAG TPA: trypsin-like serine protease [Myxococcota bacterium]